MLEDVCFFSLVRHGTYDDDAAPLEHIGQNLKADSRRRRRRLSVRCRCAWVVHHFVSSCACTGRGRHRCAKMRRTRGFVTL